MKSVFTSCSCLLMTIGLFSCLSPQEKQVDPNKPSRQLIEYFDARYLLYNLSDSIYAGQTLNQTFTDLADSTLVSDVLISCQPLGYSTNLNLQYTHVYSDKCVYTKQGDKWKYAEISFPNSCLTKDKAYAKVTLTNRSKATQQIALRLFYQNTTYWFSTVDTSISTDKHLDNFYGMSDVINVVIKPNEQQTVLLPYAIGLDPKGENPTQPYKVPARAGNYEFALIASERISHPLLQTTLDLKQVNPFSALHKERKIGSEIGIAYTSPHHFKFVLHEEFFDGTNDLRKEHVYLTKERVEKKLCDTCSGWHRKIIDEDWIADDFFTGRISKAGFVKPEFGSRTKNARIDSSGITITIPASTKEHYQKTWGEVLFGPPFKYGHITIRAKFADIFNRTGTSNGIVHNFWLYEADPPEKPTGPYADLVNSDGKQPYEIDMEFWPTNAEKGIWDDSFYINCSVIDYMRDSAVKIRPGEQTIVGDQYLDRKNNAWQMLVIPKQLPRYMFDSFHTYEIYWYPDRIEYYMDGNRLAMIKSEWAKIPDKHMFLWLGSPIYQEGNYYTISYLPFFDTPKYSIIDYIKID